jgi:hypothetical protein
MKKMDVKKKSCNEILSLVNRESVRNDFLMTKLGVKK